MANRCVKCGKLHPDEAEYILEKGCDKCGSKFFFYVNEKFLKERENEIEKLSKRDLEIIERDIREILGEEAEEETVVLDLETIHIVAPGKYRIDLTNLFSQKPLIVRVGEGIYEIDLKSLTKTKIKK